MISMAELWLTFALIAIVIIYLIGTGKVQIGV